MNKKTEWIDHQTDKEMDELRLNNHLPDNAQRVMFFEMLHRIISIDIGIRALLEAHERSNGD